MYCSVSFALPNLIAKNKVQDEKNPWEWINAKRWICGLVFFLFLSMAAGDYRPHLITGAKKMVRDLEKVSIKQIKTDCSILINSTCRRERKFSMWKQIYNWLTVLAPLQTSCSRQKELGRKIHHMHSPFKQNNKNNESECEHRTRYPILRTI